MLFDWRALTISSDLICDYEKCYFYADDSAQFKHCLHIELLQHGLCKANTKRQWVHRGCHAVRKCDLMSYTCRDRDLVRYWRPDEQLEPRRAALEHSCESTQTIQLTHDELKPTLQLTPLWPNRHKQNRTLIQKLININIVKPVSQLHCRVVTGYYLNSNHTRRRFFVLFAHFISWKRPSGRTN